MEARREAVKGVRLGSLVRQSVVYRRNLEDCEARNDGQGTKKGRHESRRKQDDQGELRRIRRENIHCRLEGKN